MWGGGGGGGGVGGCGGTAWKGRVELAAGGAAGRRCARPNGVRGGVVGSLRGVAAWPCGAGTCRCRPAAAAASITAPTNAPDRHGPSPVAFFPYPRLTRAWGGCSLGGSPPTLPPPSPSTPPCPTVALFRHDAAAGAGPVPPGTPLPLTPYAKAEQLSRTTPSALLAAATAAAPAGIRAAVITGGEPLLHARALADVIPPLLAGEPGGGGGRPPWAVEVETNGTLSPAGLPPGVTFNVSPKLSNSHQPASRRLVPGVLREFAAAVGGGEGGCFKFVVGTDADLAEVEHVVRVAGVDRRAVWLMPLGTSADEIRARGTWLVPLCMDRGYNYSHRVHVSLWGDRRGV
ncbi:hypothetical protein BU14_0334s0002 [Porphyra umbilicalis]|uniref:Radical SAM core domain-containing protein n=1 Tax=Porphyra umbilicalis TaxID=2786 RepID=A0A1X6NYA7_PORUM|nr:hypothetical protein BU14_0334s0002 [Porphyra umbilicalis]|eukprot:OSX73601.1 hypothetical protein BU14_0334s0002 [Porphyra umbilicalis]